MASAEPPPLSDDGFWFWDGSKWLSLVSADGRTSWNGKAWVPLPPFLIGKTLQPPAGPPGGLAAVPPQAPPANPPPEAAPATHALGPLASPPGYAASPSPPPAAAAPSPVEVEPRPSWLPADAPWPPATFTASPTSGPLTVDAPMAAAAPGAVPWANVYSNVIASSAATRGYSYAGFWIRFIAYFIDSLIVGIPSTLIFLFLLGGRAAIASQDQAQIQAVSSGYQLLSLGASFIYFVFFWSQGSTPGMRVVNIRVADQTTFQTIGLGKAVLRYIGWIVSSFCCLIGFIWAAFDSHKQGWHDKIGGTVVVYR
jgi:uncharacterized RDD family membrane protein YckC